MGVVNSSEGTSEVLAGGWQTTVVRRGNVVHRSPNSWSPSVLELLRHLEREGFDGSPRVVGSGFDNEGNETVSYIEGTSPQPFPWTDSAMHKLGELIGRLHGAASSFSPDRLPEWQDWFGRSLGSPANRYGHGDLGPWNVMAVEGDPVGIIDWDTAGPLDPVWELAQAGWLNAQLHDDDLAQRLGLGDAVARSRQLRILLDGYGLDRASRAGFVDKMVEVAVHDASQQAITHGVEPTTTSGTAENGYPFAWGMAWRIRGASWMLRNRRVIERELGAVRVAVLPPPDQSGDQPYPPTTIASGVRCSKSDSGRDSSSTFTCA